MTKSHAAGWASDAPTPAQLAELLRQIQVGRINKQKLQGFLRDGAPSTVNDKLAREILGNDFIGSEEIAVTRGVSYSPEQLNLLADTFPTNEEQFRWLKRNNYALVAGPPAEMSLLDVYALNPKIFLCDSRERIYREWMDYSSRDEKVSCEWLAVRKEPVPDSRNKNWKKQQSVLSEEEYIPNAVAMCWFVTTYYEVREIRLFSDVDVRTMSIAFDNNIVLVGPFVEDGLHVHHHYDHLASCSIGVASARKFY